MTHPLHSDFSTAEVLAYDKISGLICASPEKCEEKINLILLQLNCVIMNWEQSGQDGGVDGTDISNDDGSNATKHSTFGTLANWMDRALNLQKSFVAYNQSYFRQAQFDEVVNAEIE